MTKSTVFSNNGFTYLESLVSLLIIGFCALILNAELPAKERGRTNLELHTRAILALSSQADLIRSGMAPLTPGKHPFVKSEYLLKNIPDARAHYAVSETQTPGLLKVMLRIDWKRGVHREFQIYVQK